MLEVYSADNGQLMLQTDLLLDHEIELTKNKDDRDLFSMHSNFGNLSPQTHLAVWSDSQSTLYSMSVDIGGDKDEKGELSFVPKATVLQKRTLTYKPADLIAAKQRATYKLVAWDQAAKQIHVYSHDRLEEEMVVLVDVKHPDELRLMQQTVGLLYYTKQEIGFFKLLKAPTAPDGKKEKPKSLEERIKTLKSKPVCFSNFYDIDQIVFDPVSAGTFIALSKKDNAIVLFQA